MIRQGSSSRLVVLFLALQRTMWSLIFVITITVSENKLPMLTAPRLIILMILADVYQTLVLILQAFSRPSNMAMMHYRTSSIFKAPRVPVQVQAYWADQ